MARTCRTLHAMNTHACVHRRVCVGLAPVVSMDSGPLWSDVRRGLAWVVFLFVTCFEPTALPTSPCCPCNTCVEACSR